MNLEMPVIPQERSLTVRKALLAALRHGPITAKELSARIGVAERDVVGHLEHLERSLRHGKEALRLIPPSCLDCGFVFRKRERMSRPGACPKCRGTHIEAPRFAIDAGDSDSSGETGDAEDSGGHDASGDAD